MNNIKSVNSDVVKVGQKITLPVMRFGNDGDPILIHNGLVIFLKGVREQRLEAGMMVDIKITKLGSNCAFAAQA